MKLVAAKSEEGDMSGYQTIRYQRQGDVGTLTLARPGKRNAQNPLMWQELGRLGADLVPDESLRCLVVTGEGPAFSAGIDLVEGIGGILADFAEQPPDARSLDAGRAAAGTFGWIPDLGCASVAAVRGHAYGAGLQLALACDFRIFAEGTKVGLLETRYGLLPDMGATVRLPRIVGESRARELILLGDIIDADEALRIGLANRVVPGDDLLEEQMRCLRSDDFAEARQAMTEGRAPQWRGR
jgi:enoyl-CoA hydratase/carnithine racemase